MGYYRVSPWFSHGVYYSLFFHDVHSARGRRSQTKSAVTLRFDVNAMRWVKLEGHRMNGTRR